MIVSPYVELTLLLVDKYAPRYFSNALIHRVRKRTPSLCFLANLLL